MTTSDHPPPEALSASLDGEAPEWALHLEGCARCRTELARLRAVSEAVRRPVALPPLSVVDEAVARALEAAGGTGKAKTGNPVSRIGGQRSRAFVVGVASGSVAAVLLVVLAAFAVIDRGADQTAVDTALAPGRESTAQDRATAGAAGQPPGGFTAGGDLGEVGDPGALAGRLGGRIPGTGGAPAPITASPAGGAEAAVPPAADGVPYPCEPQARVVRPGLGPLVYAAGGTRQGRPVAVLGFGPGAAGAEAVSLLVLARDGCELVYATSVL